MTNPFDKSIKDDILKAIESGKVTMRPKWHFALTAALLFAGSVLVALVLIYLVSFLFFIGQGVGENASILLSLPWLVIAMAIVCLIILEVLVRKFAFAYRKPLLYTIFGILALVILTGFVLANTPLHKNLSNRAYEDHLPFGGEFYKHYDHRPHPPRPGHEIYPPR